MEVLGKRRRGRPKQRCLDNIVLSGRTVRGGRNIDPISNWERMRQKKYSRDNTPYLS